MIQADKNKRINTDLLYGDLTYKVRGAIFNVYNELGFGHKENIYQKALIKEFETLNIIYKQEVGLDVKYKGDVVGKYRPDFTIEDKIIIELKSVEFMPKSYEEQLLHYLKTTGYLLGLLVNFGSNKLYIKRFIWTNNQWKSAGKSV
jgi:GxxExxY protein